MTEDELYESHRRSKIGGLLFVFPIGIVILLKDEFDISFIIPVICIGIVAALATKFSYKIIAVSGLVGALGFILKDRFSSPLAGYVLLGIAMVGLAIFAIFDGRRQRRS